MERIKVADGSILEVESVIYSDMGVVETLTIELKDISLLSAVISFSDKEKMSKITHMENDTEVATYEGFTKVVSAVLIYRIEDVVITLHKE